MHGTHDHTLADKPSDPMRSSDAPSISVDPPAALPRDHHPGVVATIWNGITAAIATVMGLVPHVLHHVGLFAGAVLVTGLGGNLLFGGLGLLFSIPLLRRLYRRFRTWKAPAIAVAVFAVMFSISAFLIGPALSDSAPRSDLPAPTGKPAPTDHGAHHGD